MSYLSIHNLCKNYGDVMVLKELCLDIEEGSFTTLLGPSGCGKSTLLRQLVGIEVPDKGEIMVEGKTITKLPTQKRNIGMVFQNYALFPNLSVFENIAFGLRFQKINTKKIQEKVMELLKMMHLESKQDSFPHQLSGGQKQRVSLARAIILEPKILLLDEPLSALDAKVREDLRVQIKKIQRRLDLTIIFVTHDQEEALSISDRIVVMNEGKIEQDDTPENIYNHPKTKFVAQFIGNYNMLESKTYEDLFGSTCDGQQVVIKPESIYFSEQGLPVEIRESYLLGNIIRYEATHKDVRFKIDCLNDHPMFARHESKNIQIKKQEIIVLKQTPERTL